MNAQSVQRVLDLCHKNDPKAFDLLTEIFGKQLYAFIYRMTQNRELTDDILQETMLKTFQCIKSYDRNNPQGFQAWIFKIARNECVDRLRSEARRSRREALWLRLTAAACKRENPAAHSVVENEKRQEMRQAIHSLPLKQKTAFALFAIEELSIKEIAEIMGCSKGTVMSHLHRARTSLRKIMRFDKAYWDSD